MNLRQMLTLVAAIAVATVCPFASAQSESSYWEPVEVDGGLVVVGDYVFDNWVEYYQSDLVWQLHQQRLDEEWRQRHAALLGVDPSDCTLEFNNPSDAYEVDEIYYIPTVVHNITRFNGTTGFVSDEDIQTAIDMLNADFSGAQGGVDTGIRFFLAYRDPLDEATNGVDRCCGIQCQKENMVFPCNCCENSLWFEEIPGENYWNPAAWNPFKYMNIYTTRGNGDPMYMPDDPKTPDVDEEVLGLGYVPFLPQNGQVGERADRVVVNSFYFGPNPALGAPYDENHVLTHQVGHYLGLYNTYAGGCAMGPAVCNTQGDLICETAPQSVPSDPNDDNCLENDPECGFLKNSGNFMDLAADECRFGFTEEQARRMRCTLLNYRPDLWVTEDKTMPPPGDVCETAEPLPLGNMVVSNVFATTERDTNLVVCGKDPDELGEEARVHFEHDLWFEFTTEEAGELDVRACLATYNTELAIYEECVTLFDVPLLCDTVECGGFARLTLTLSPGTYYVRLGGKNGLTGNATLQTSFSAIIDCNNNLIQDATDIADGTSFDCDSNQIPDECQIENSTAWASAVVDFSSQFSTTEYAATQTLGPADVFTYGDNPNAWVGSSMNGTIEFLQLEYETPVYTDSVVIRETWGAGSVRKVELVDTDDELHTVFEGIDPSPAGAIAAFRVSYPRTDYLVKGVRIEIDTDANLSEWEEIDAVLLGGSTLLNDCNNNGLSDFCDVQNGLSPDCDGNDVPDECDPDCNANGVPDGCEPASEDCDSNGVPDECQEVTFAQVADSVLGFSSQFSPGNYSAAQATGTPNVFAYGDNSNAWTSSTMNGTREHVSVGFPEAVFASGVTIRETWGAGCVVQVDVIDLSDKLHTVWVGEDTSPPGAIANFFVEFGRTDFLVKGVRITIDTDATQDEWEEIDAVTLHGSRSTQGDCNNNGVLDGCETVADCNENGVPDECEVGRTDQFAAAVLDFSSQFSATSYAATQALLGPDVFAYGDNPDAWVASSQNGTNEFLTVGFDRMVFATGATIRETWGNGFVTQIDVIDENDQEVTVWAGVDPSQPGSVVEFSPTWPRTAFLVKGLKIYTDTDATAVWEEVDTVMLHGFEPGINDSNNNSIPDDCEPNPCPADCSPDNGDGTFGNGVVNIDDLLSVISAFGSAGGPCDIAPDNGDGTFGNGIVNIDDLLMSVSSFGPCE